MVVCRSAVSCLKTKNICELRELRTQNSGLGDFISIHFVLGLVV